MPPKKVPILDSGDKVPTAKLGGGTAGSRTYLRGDQQWSIVNPRDAWHPNAVLSSKDGVIMPIITDINSFDEVISGI